MNMEAAVKKSLRAVAHKILKAALEADAKGKPYSAQREELERILPTAEPADAALIQTAWQLFDEYRHEYKRKDARAYLAEFEGLTGAGYGDAVAVLIERVQPSLAECTFLEVARCFGSVSALRAWLKRMKITPKACADHVARDPDATYPTILAEWAAEHVAVGKLNAILARVLSDTPRPLAFASSRQILLRVIENDGRADVVKLILAKAATDEAAALRVSRAILAVSPVGASWSCAIAAWLSASGLAERKEAFVASAEEALHAARGDGGYRIAAFVAATVAIMANSKPAAKESERQRIQDLLARLVDASSALASSANVEGVWFCSPSKAIGRPHPQQAEVLSARTARHVAFAMRAVEAGSSADLALEALGVNLGVVPIGACGEIVAFDPLRHEDTVGGLLPLAAAMIVMRGWESGENVLVRAQVRSAEEVPRE